MTTSDRTWDHDSAAYRARSGDLYDRRQDGRSMSRGLQLTTTSERRSGNRLTMAALASGRKGVQLVTQPLPRTSRERARNQPKVICPYGKRAPPGEREVEIATMQKANLDEIGPDVRGRIPRRPPSLWVSR